MSYQSQGFDINQDSEYSDSKFVTKIFKPKVNYTMAKAGQRFVVLPAHVQRFADVSDPAAVDPRAIVPYRTPAGAFSAWVNGYRAFGFFGPERNHSLLSPKTFDPKALDPMAILWDTVQSSPEFYELGGLGADGKKDQKNKDAYKNAIVGPPQEFRIVNALEVENDGQLGKNTLAVLRKTAFGWPQNTDWGLVGELQKQLPPKFQKEVEVTGPDGTYYDWSNHYNVGDLTDPDRAMPIEVYKKKPANGGLEQFNCRIVTDKSGYPTTVVVPDEALEGRYYLGDVLLYTEPTELIELMFDLFKAHPQLLRRAFQNHVANVDSRLKQAGIVSDSRVRQVGGRRDEPAGEEMGATSTAPAPTPAPARSRFTDRRESSTALQTTTQNDTEDAGDEIPGVPSGRAALLGGTPTTPTRVPATPPSRFAPRAAAAPGSTMATAPAATTTPIAKPAQFAPRSAKPGVEVEQKPRTESQADREAEALLAQLDAQESAS